MRKIISFRIGLVILSLLGFSLKVNAKQTLEEATDSLKHIMSLAKEGDATAQNIVGGWYYQGKHVDQNYEEALQWWAKSAKQGNIRAIGNMGLCYQTGNCIKADPIKALKLYQHSTKEGNKELFDQNVSLARNGNVFSCMLISSCYHNGIGVKKDPAQAAPFLTTAAEKNCVLAQRDLGLLLLNQNKAKEAVKWFIKGAGNDNLTCIFYYGKMLLEGLGTKMNKNEGADYLLKAAREGFPQAMYYVGNCYKNGDGLKRTDEQAVKWYQAAAGKGVSNAEWQLAQCYRTGLGPPVDYEPAMYWYARCVPKGHLRAFKQLVKDSIPDSPFVTYLNGRKSYSERKYEVALKDFKKVSKKGIEDGSFMEAVTLFNSGNPKNNPKKGVKILQKLSKSYPLAMFVLGEIYESGKEVKQNIPEAVRLISKAAEMGNDAAQLSLADMYFEGRNVEQNYSKAVEWYEKAYLQGRLTEPTAKRFASCYENGWGVEEDKSKAEAILKSVAEVKFEDIFNIL